MSVGKSELLCQQSSGESFSWRVGGMMSFSVYFVIFILNLNALKLKFKSNPNIVRCEIGFQLIFHRILFFHLSMNSISQMILFSILKFKQENSFFRFIHIWFYFWVLSMNDGMAKGERIQRNFQQSTGLTLAIPFPNRRINLWHHLWIRPVFIQ